MLGDPHVDPDFHNDRFEWAGNLIVYNRPDHIVQMGDFGNLDSISFHDRGKPRLQEGKRLKDDLEAMQDAYDKLMAPLKEFNSRVSSLKKKKYNPRIFWLEGNHEERVRRFIDMEPAFEGFVPETDFVGAGLDGATIVRYRNFCYINGVAFTHAVLAERANVPIGGKYVGARVCDAVQTSCVYGHHHHRQFHSITRINPATGKGTAVDSLCAGTYSDYYPDYMKDNALRSNWWSGAIVLYHTEFGRFDYETISMERIKKEYS